MATLNLASIGGAQMLQEHDQVVPDTADVLSGRRAYFATAVRLAPTPPARPEPGVPHPRVGERSAADGRGPQRAPELEVRLHTPIPQVVIVRVAGILDRAGVALLSRRVGQQITRAEHVVLDLDEMADLGCHGVAVLLDLHREASAQGTTLYVAGAEHEAIRGPLRLAGAEHVLTLAPCADAVIALLRGRRCGPAGPARGPR